MSRFSALKVSLALALTFSAVFGGSTPLVCASTIYVTIQGAPSDPKFGSFDTTSGAFSSIATSGLDSPESLRGLTWDESLNAFRTILVDGTLTEKLTTITTSGAVGSRVAMTSPSDGYYGIATTGSADPLYTFVSAVGITQEIGTTNRGTGAWSTVAGANSGFGLNSSFSAYGIMSFYGNTLYAAGRTFNSVPNRDIFGTLNTSTGLFTQIGAANDAFFGMALASDGTALYGVSVSSPNPGIYSINPSTGVPTLVTAVTGFPEETYVVGAGMAASPVPEPAICLLALTSLAGGYATWRRRRRGG